MPRFLLLALALPLAACNNSVGDAPEAETTAVAPVDAGELTSMLIYGDRDSVVRTELSASVADHARSLAERVVIAGADHNDAVMFGPRVADAVARLANSMD